MQQISYQAPLYPLNQTYLKEFIEETLNNFFSENNQDCTKIDFKFDDSTIKFELKVLDFFSKISIHSSKMDDFYDSLRGKNARFEISFSFKNTIFEKCPSFDHLHCHSLDFYNTVFKQGAKIRWVTAKEIDYSPRTLDADVTFVHEGYADIDNKKLSILKISSIQKLKFRHNLEGNGWTYFIGLHITEKADFTNTVLNKVHFSNMNMENCYFANAIIQDTRFINCDFPKTKDLWTGAMSKTGNITNNAKLYGLVATILFFLILVALIWMLGSLDQWLILSILLLFSIPFFVYPFLFLNKYLFGWHERFCMHFSTADEKLAFEEKNPELFSKNINLVREIYRQLRTNLEKNNDFQKAGEFYFSQRHIEAAMFDFEDPTKSAMQQLLMYSLHWINGFGERWVRSFVWFFLTIIIFSFAFVPNNDFIATPETPPFLLQIPDDNITVHDNYFPARTLSFPKDYNQTKFANNENILYRLTDNNTTVKIEKYVIKFKEDDNLNVRLTYSLSHLVAPFTPDEKKWFTTHSEKAYILGFLETILLWLFAFAGAVAINNRIKR